MKIFISILLLLFTLLACSTSSSDKKDKQQASNPIQNDTLLQQVKSKALDVVKTGFNAGDGYGEVWIRDYNTFIEGWT